MSRLAELAYDLDAHRDQPDPARDLTIARIAERLSILGQTQESTELAQHAADLRALLEPPTCTMCGKAVTYARGLSHHVAPGRIFCSRACMDDALTIPDDLEMEPPPEVPHA